MVRVIEGVLEVKLPWARLGTGGRTPRSRKLKLAAPCLFCVSAAFSDFGAAPRGGSCS